MGEPPTWPAAPGAGTRGRRALLAGAITLAAVAGGAALLLSPTGPLVGMADGSAVGASGQDDSSAGSTTVSATSSTSIERISSSVTGPQDGSGTVDDTRQATDRGGDAPPARPGTTVVAPTVATTTRSSTTRATWATTTTTSGTHHTHDPGATITLSPTTSATVDHDTITISIIVPAVTGEPLEP